MDAVTYPDIKVIGFIDKQMVPLRLPADAPLAAEFKVTWTPTLVILDCDGNERHRIVGFMPPDELIPAMEIGMAKAAYDIGRYDDAVIHLDNILHDYPSSGAAPESVFMRGVCRYKSSHAAGPLKEAYEKLAADYPESEWTKRAHPYSLL